jgi:hypothetical protein
MDAFPHRKSIIDKYLVRGMISTSRAATLDDLW